MSANDPARVPVSRWHFVAPFASDPLDLVRQKVDFGRVASAAAQRFPGIHTKLTTLSSTAYGLHDTLAVQNVREFAKVRVSGLKNRVGLGLIDAVSPILHLLLPEAEDVASADTDNEEASDVMSGMHIPLSMKTHDFKTFVVQISNMARLRVTLLNTAGVCDSMLKKLRPSDIRQILTQAHLAGMQQQLAHQTRGGLHIPERAVQLLSRSSRRILGPSLTDLLAKVVERAAAVASGALPEGAQHFFIKEGSNNGSVPAPSSCIDSTEAPTSTCSITHDRSCDSSATPQVLDEPVMIRLVIRNSFIQLVEDETPRCKRRTRSLDDIIGRSHGITEPYTFIGSIFPTTNAARPRRVPLQSAAIPSVTSVADSCDRTVAGNVVDIPGRDDDGANSRVQTSRQDDVVQNCQIHAPLQLVAQDVVSTLGQNVVGAKSQSPNVRECVVLEGQHTQVVHLDEGILNGQSQVVGIDKALPETARGRKTVELRNLPAHYSRAQLLAVLDDRGFGGRYRFVYVPMDFAQGMCLGYAMVHMVSAQDAEELQKSFDASTVWPGWECEARYCDTTFSDLVERYRNSPVMHDSVPDELKPAVFHNAQRCRFPAPTKPIRRPRIRTGKAQRLEAMDGG